MKNNKRRITLIEKLTAIALSPDIGYPAGEGQGNSSHSKTALSRAEIDSAIMASFYDFLSDEKKKQAH